MTKILISPSYGAGYDGYESIQVNTETKWATA